MNVIVDEVIKLQSQRNPNIIMPKDELEIIGDKLRPCTDNTVF